ncbi:MAG: hypothetical protein COB37_12415 [Kordiimonadales bacterium]|nr:MAG: hypothetical protein COB37_12415 [Kordiimonadales bacterium]
MLIRFLNLLDTARHQSNTEVMDCNAEPLDCGFFWLRGSWRPLTKVFCHLLRRIPWVSFVQALRNQPKAHLSQSESLILPLKRPLKRFESLLRKQSLTKKVAFLARKTEKKALKVAKK